MTIGKIKVVRFTKVISIDDDADADRIKVRLQPEDNGKSIEELPYAFPFIPKMIHIKPKVGEAVLVILTVTNDGNSQRYYVGPVISQDHRLYDDPYFMGADSFTDGCFKKFDPAPSLDPKQHGIFPNDDDIVIRGRKNTDIQITEDDIRIKAGVKVVKEEASHYAMEFNGKDPAYIKVKYSPKGFDKLSEKSYVSLVGDKIVLMGNHSSLNVANGRGALHDPDDLLTDEDFRDIVINAEKVPYGKKLVKFLSKFVNTFVSHTHPYPMFPPCPTKDIVDLTADKAMLLDNEQMLSDNIRIN